MGPIRQSLVRVICDPMFEQLEMVLQETWVLQAKLAVWTGDPAVRHCMQMALQVELDTLEYELK